MASDRLTIATYNVNSVRQRLESLIEWMAFNDPDIVCLQETKVQDADFPADDLIDAGYHVVFKGMKSYNGVAIVSKEEPSDVSWGFDDGGEPDEARLIRARYGDVAVLNTYVPQGRDMESEHYTYKLEWFRRIRALMDRHYSPDEPLLWTGDLNVAPEDMDVYAPDTLRGSVCFNPELTSTLRETMSWGLTDVFRKHRPDPGEFSFWDYRIRGALDLNRGWRIDHLLATAPLADRSIDAYVDREPRDGLKPSDHTLVVGVFAR